MYEPRGRMRPGPFDVFDWDTVPVRWFPTGWASGETEALEPFRREAERQLERPVGVLSLIGIKPGGFIPPHEDGLTTGWLRRHLVLRSNAWCWSYHADGWQRLDVGGIYLMDANQVHASINLGETMRWHLIADTNE